MSRRIVQDVGGTIQVADAPSGTRFCLRLPVVTGQQPDASPDHEMRVQHA
jgi:signal transduction histidine kinase